MDIDHHIIPKHLDDPAMYLMFDADEAYAFLAPVAVVLAFSRTALSFAIAACLGYFAMRTLARIKASGGKQLIQHALYWYLPTEAWFKFVRTPPSDIREFIGG